jgi:hypothetical protein
MDNQPIKKITNSLPAFNTPQFWYIAGILAVAGYFVWKNWKGK